MYPSLARLQEDLWSVQEAACGAGQRRLAAELAGLPGRCAGVGAAPQRWLTACALFDGRDAGGQLTPRDGAARHGVGCRCAACCHADVTTDLVLIRARMSQIPVLVQVLIAAHVACRRRCVRVAVRGVSIGGPRAHARCTQDCSSRHKSLMEDFALPDSVRWRWELVAPCRIEHECCIMQYFR